MAFGFKVIIVAREMGKIIVKNCTLNSETKIAGGSILVNLHEFEILKSLLRVPILPIPSFVIF